MNTILISDKKFNRLVILRTKQGILKVEVAITLFIITLVVGMIAFLSLPYVADARNVMALANCRNVYVSAEVCLNNPKSELTFETYLEETLGNGADVEGDPENPGYYSGDFADGDIIVQIDGSELIYVSWTSTAYENVSAYWDNEDGFKVGE